MNYLLIAIGGALGAMSRYAVFELLRNFEHKHIRLGVFTVNILGSLLIGITLALAVNKIGFERHKVEHFIFVTGFLGAFTTFSTFSQDNVEFLLLEHNIIGLFVNVFANILIGFLACLIGYTVMTKMFS